MNKGTGIAEQISPFYGTVIAEHSQQDLYELPNFGNPTPRSNCIKIGFQDKT